MFGSTCLVGPEVYDWRAGVCGIGCVVLGGVVIVSVLLCGGIKHHDCSFRCSFDRCV